MNNELRISYSSSTCFKACPEKHYLSYILGCRPKEEGASLSFGIAVDEAIGMLLRAKRDNQELPKLEQVQNEFLFHSEKGFEQHFDSMKLRYTKADVDPKVFNQEDWATISLFEKELHCSMEEARKAFNQKSFKKMSSDEDRMYSRLGFLSLKAKGKLMIEAFYKEVLPEIEEVVAVQHKFEGEIGGYKLIGYLDYMLEKKVSVQFVKENLLFKDKSNHISNLMLNMMGSFAEFEYSIIKERVIEGVKIAKAAGKYKGGTCKLTPHTKEVLTELIKTRKSKRQMAFELGVTLKTLLKYMRMMGYGDMIGPPRILKPGQVVGENSNYRDTWRGENNNVLSHGSSAQKGGP